MIIKRNYSVILSIIKSEKFDTYSQHLTMSCNCGISKLAPSISAIFFVLLVEELVVQILGHVIVSTTSDIDCSVSDELMLKSLGHSTTNIGKKAMDINKILWMMFFIEFHKIKLSMPSHPRAIIF